SLHATVKVVRGQVEREIGDAQRDYWFLVITTANRWHARDQFTRGKWLGQIIIGPELQATHSIVDSAARRQQQYTTGEMVATQPSQKLETVDSRQANIEHDQVEWSLA